MTSSSVAAGAARAWSHWSMCQQKARLFELREPFHRNKVQLRVKIAQLYEHPPTNKAELVRRQEEMGMPAGRVIPFGPTFDQLESMSDIGRS